MAYELKDYLNSINFTKQDVMKTDDITWEKKYPAFIVNKCLSYHYDTLIAANEMNGYHFLPNNMQYQFLLNIVRKKKRFAKWMKAEKLKDIEYVKEYYGYSNEKAKTALSILTKNDIEHIKKSLNKGGRKRK
tara:strand:- start:1171 stop:1566 length:396 start_codon:yes stop_codon:yes gene_type:complete